MWSDTSKGLWEGVVQIPQGQATVESRGVDVTVSILSVCLDMRER